MESLETIVNALQKEVTNALSKTEPSPGHLKWEADRVVVTLALSMKNDPHGMKFEFARSDASIPSNSLSIEFNLQKGSAHMAARSLPPLPAKKPRPTQAPTQNLPRAAADEVTNALCLVFDRPGFDSAARATVFCEACQDLLPEHRAALLQELADDQPASDAPEILRARALIQRVCQSGPTESVKGRKILAHVFQTWDPDAVLRLIVDTWKTQNDWLIKSR